VTKGASIFTFVTDGIESTVPQAKTVAGDKNVGMMGANTSQQCIKAGLIDEIHLHLVPVLLGEGIRLFDHSDSEQVELESLRVMNPGIEYRGL
jgi:dihydrofolate reductase